MQKADREPEVIERVVRDARTLVANGENLRHRRATSKGGRGGECREAPGVR